MARTRAKGSHPARSSVRGASYTLGSIWNVAFIRVKHGRFEDYAKHLVAAKRTLDEERKEGLVVSYRFLSGPERDRDDFNVMALVEYPDWGTLDRQDRFAAATNRVYGSQRARGRGVLRREEIRETMGMRWMQEIHPK